MNLSVTVLVVNFILFCESKKYLLKTEKLSGNQNLNTTIRDEEFDVKHDDYMVDIDIQSVDVGQPVELKCASPKEFSACFFSKPEGHILYKIRPNFRFEGNRLQCLSVCMILCLYQRNL